MTTRVGRAAFRSILAKGRPVGAVGVVVVLGWLCELRPELRYLRIFSKPQTLLVEPSPRAVPQAPKAGEAVLLESSGSGELPAAAPSSATGPALFAEPARPAEVTAPDVEAPPVSLEAPETLARFFSSLDETRRATVVAPRLTRVLHFGDSVIVSDYVSATLRRLFQQEFGDAGHGYQLIANAWPSYRHDAVAPLVAPGFRAFRISGPTTKDRLYGVGGVAFLGSSGLVARFGTAERGEFGRSVSSFTVSYLTSPGGGGFSVHSDGRELGSVDTSAPLGSSERTFRVPDGPHQFEIHLRGAPSRLFGVVLERDVPGVVWSALGVQGARLHTFAEIEPTHFSAQIAARQPDLLVFQFGINESGDGYAIAEAELTEGMRGVLELARRAASGGPCLVVGAMDRARMEQGQITSMRVIPRIVKAQRQASAAAGCAFFDTYSAMGGFGSMPRWVKRQLGNPDMMHPSGVGAERIATWIYRALMESYREYQKGSRGDSP